jgi:hypothetical protein
MRIIGIREHQSVLRFLLAQDTAGQPALFPTSFNDTNKTNYGGAARYVGNLA